MTGVRSGVFDAQLSWHSARSLFILHEDPRDHNAHFADAYLAVSAVENEPPALEQGEGKDDPFQCFWSGK